MSPRAIITHTLDHARHALHAAAESGCSVTLQSAPDAAHSAGSLYLKAMVDAACEEYPGVECQLIVDCGDDAMTAFQALRCGHTKLLVHLNKDAEIRLRAIASSRHATLEDNGGETLDLATCRDAYGACSAWLQQDCKLT
jgi:hypothetical protein